ncbi:MAG: hypothetical protein JWO31_1593 [Phycisphaerales bacterium]|nr:hypothetical protein [Phycisphaerales bacterium]
MGHDAPKPAPPPVERLVYNQTEAAAAMGVTDRTFRKWEGAGLIRGYRKNGKVQYLRADLERLARTDATFEDKRAEPKPRSPRAGGRKRNG